MQFDKEQSDPAVKTTTEAARRPSEIINTDVPLVRNAAADPGLKAGKEGQEFWANISGPLFDAIGAEGSKEAKIPMTADGQADVMSGKTSAAGLVATVVSIANHAGALITAAKAVPDADDGGASGIESAGKDGAGDA